MMGKHNTMDSTPKTQDQQHPQYRRDRATVDTLLAGEATDYNLSELARLKIRYRGFPGARDIQKDLEKVLQQWNLTAETLYEQTRKIHAKGEVYRKQKSDQEDWA
jgi:ATP sulfurylase